MTSILDQLSELERAATEGPWAADNEDYNARGYIAIPCPVMRGEHNSIRGGTHEDAKFIAALRNRASAFLDLWEAAKNNPCRHYAEQENCPTCAALAKLEAIE